MNKQSIITILLALAAMAGQGQTFTPIVEEMPTNINLVTGEVSGSELQQRFIRCQMREREIHCIVQPWWNSLSDEDKERIITMRMDGLPDATAANEYHWQASSRL